MRDGKLLESNEAGDPKVEKESVFLLHPVVKLRSSPKVAKGGFLKKGTRAQLRIVPFMLAGTIVGLQETACSISANPLRPVENMLSNLDLLPFSIVAEFVTGNVSNAKLCCVFVQPTAICLPVDKSKLNFKK